MRSCVPLFIYSFASIAAAQTVGPTKEVHPKLTTYQCSIKEGCKAQEGALVLDSSSHPIFQKDNPTLGCGDWGSGPDPLVCPDVETCAQNCIIDGISNYADYGVTSQGDSFVLNIYGKNDTVARPRVYLLDGTEEKYELLNLTGMELSFDVDVSHLPCGMNGALYLSEMEVAGGQSQLNPAGPAYGTGYCDAQCYITPWVNGLGNVEGAGVCCGELDIWEANKRATQFAPHTCSEPGLYLCSGEECSKSGVCDKNGCGHNPYRLGKLDYYSPNGRINTLKPFTVITQFPAKDGILQSIVRKYVQDGRVIENAMENVNDVVDDTYCRKNGATDFMRNGAMKGMGESMARGMVLAMSIWWDEDTFMNWLDADGAGPCNSTEGNPAVIQKIEKSPRVQFSKIMWGEIGSTFAINRTVY